MTRSSDSRSGLILWALAIVALGFHCDGNPVHPDPFAETQLAAGATFVRALWNSPGDRLAVTKQEPDKPGQLVFINLWSRQVTPYNVPPLRYFYPLGWIPNTNQLATWASTDPDSANYTQGLWIVNSDSMNHRMVSIDGSNTPSFHGAVAHQSDTLAYVHGFDIYLLSAGGGTPRRLATFATESLPNAYIDWSADDKEVMVTWDDVFAVRVADSHVSLRLTRSMLSQRSNSASWLDGTLAYATCQPNGTWIAFNLLRYDYSDHNLYMFNSADSTVRTIGQGHLPAWSPDGKWISYTKQDGALYMKRVNL